MEWEKHPVSLRWLHDLRLGAGCGAAIANRCPVSHEQSETIQRKDGKWINIYGRKTKRAGHKLPASGVYDTVKDAEAAAVHRSRMYDTSVNRNHGNEKKRSLTMMESDYVNAMKKKK